jgi:hypothetical protein
LCAGFGIELGQHQCCHFVDQMIHTGTARVRQCLQAAVFLIG